jgi:hypothetical protein
VSNRPVLDATAGPEPGHTPRKGDRPQRVARAGLPFLAALAAMAWFFRATWAERRLPGDLGDARWSVALTEHWHAVWRGDAPVRTVGFFAPLDATLGMSDPFLVQGQFHAAARVVGATPVTAWFGAHLAMYAIGALGVAVLARRLVAGVGAQVLFVLVACLSYPLVSHMNHVQVFGFLWVAWLVVALDELRRPAGNRRRLAAVAALALGPPLLALSSWYAFAMGGLVLATLGAALALMSPRAAVRAAVGETIGAVGATLRTPPGASMAVFGAGLWVFALWVYLPARELVPPPTWDEVVFFSPRWDDLVNASLGGGGVWSELYQWLFGDRPATGERELGFTVVLAATLVVSGPLAASARARSASGTPARRAADQALACWLTVVGLCGLFVVTDDGWGLFRFLFDTVPGMESLRSPFRVQILLYPLAVITVLRATEAVASGYPTGSRRRTAWGAVLPVVLLGVILVEGVRPPISQWRSSELMPPTLAAVVGPAQGCPMVVVAEQPDGRPVWQGSVDAVLFSMTVEAPTAQGYSRSWPVGHPGPQVPPEVLLGWLGAGGYRGEVCVIWPAGIERRLVG